MLQVDTSLAFVLEYWCVLSSIFRISRVPLQDSTMNLVVVISALSILMKAMRCKPIPLFQSLRRTSCILSDNDIKLLKETRVLYFTFMSPMEFTDCTEGKCTLSISVRKKTVSFQKFSYPFCFGDLFEIEVIRKSWRKKSNQREISCLQHGVNLP